MLLAFLGKTMLVDSFTSCLLKVSIRTRMPKHITSHAPKTYETLQGNNTAGETLMLSVFNKACDIFIVLTLVIIWLAGDMGRGCSEGILPGRVLINIDLGNFMY